jgi:feruloyl-CoA synthase
MWIERQVERELGRDGSVLLRNSLPPAAGPPNLGVWLRQHAARVPAKPYLAERGPTGDWRRLSYGDALVRTNRLSNGLLELGLDGSRAVAILSENSIAMALLQQAAIQVGIPVAPISLSYSVRSQTGAHLKHILGVTEPPVLVLSDANLHMPKLRQWDFAQVRLYAVSNAEGWPGVEPIEALEAGGGLLSSEGERRFAEVTPDTVAKIQFTSGSTNLPKGVIVTHGMMVSNQVGIGQLWPFLSEDEVVVDWLPWNHTFGGNFVANLILRLGGTLYIDHGNPTPEGVEVTLRNLRETSPTIYFGVPRNYGILHHRMTTDAELRAAFFKNLKFMFTAAAALDQVTFQGIRAMSASVRGTPLPFLSGWGSTETAPGATLVYWDANDPRVIGIPLPGVTVKLAPDASGKQELRVKGPNVSPGYYRDSAATAGGFDAEGFYRTGDAGALRDPNDPAAGLVFDGRIGEDFKLSTGTWVHNARLRASVNAIGQPLLLDVVVAAPDRDYLTALVFPNVPVLRTRLPELSQRESADEKFLAAAEVRNLFVEVFRRHNAELRGSSERFVRFMVLTVPPRMDRNETTDKGYLNQRAVLTHRADLVARLYEEVPPEEVTAVGPDEAV